MRVNPPVLLLLPSLKLPEAYGSREGKLKGAHKAPMGCSMLEKCQESRHLAFKARDSELVGIDREGNDRRQLIAVTQS